MGEVSELWKITAFRRLLIARVVSNIGNGITPIALAFGVLSIPGADAGSLSYVTTAQMIPLVLFMLVGGVGPIDLAVHNWSALQTLLEASLLASARCLF